MKKLLTNIYLSYLRFFSRLRLKKVKPLIIGVGGSSGKTSTALLISQILKSRFDVLESKGKNSQTGIPLSILGIDPGKYRIIDWLGVAIKVPFKALSSKRFDAFVIEMGIDSPFPPNNMDFLLRIVRPDIAVLTNITLEHSVYFDPLTKTEKETQRREEILKFTASEELSLIKNIKTQGYSVVNMDNNFIKDSLNSLTSNVQTVSEKDKDATFYIKSQKNSLKEYILEFVYKGKDYSLSLNHPLPNHYGYTICLALSASVCAGMEIDEALSSLKTNLKLPPGRLSVFRGVKESLIIDSSYNSSIDPTIEVIEMVSNIANGKRKVGILGDMREMGTLTKITHEELAKVILEKLDFAILIGPSMDKYVAPILKKNNFKFISFKTFDKARYRIPQYIKKRDLILVKGSQNTLFLERAVESLLKDKKDVAFLCRRGVYWDEQRRVT